jgi:large subunit ribosomal protein L9
LHTALDLDAQQRTLPLPFGECIPLDFDAQQRILPLPFGERLAIDLDAQQRILPLPFGERLAIDLDAQQRILPFTANCLTSHPTSGTIHPLNALYPSLERTSKFSEPLRKGLKMKVLLVKDVYKLGHAGDVKKVADGYGRNYLLPQGLAVLATPGAVKQADHIRRDATEKRTVLNQEMSGMASKIEGVRVTFGVKAGDNGKLYGSITHEMIAKAISDKIGTEVDRRLVEVEPIRKLGEYPARVRLTVDLTPQVKVLVHREGDAPVFEADEEPEAEMEAEEVVAEAEVVETAEVEETEEE